MSRKSASHRAGKAVLRSHRKSRFASEARAAVEKERLQGESASTLAAISPGHSGSERGPIEERISQIFGQVVADVRSQMKEEVCNTDPGKVIRPAHSSAVDIRLAFKSLDIKGRGLIFRRDQKESSISLELVTRVLPDE